MIHDLQKRPFVRLLFLWITGILLQVCFPIQQWSLCLLVPVSVALALSFCFSGQGHATYRTRWVWGMLFGCLLLFISIQATVSATQGLSHPRATSRLQQQALHVQGKMAHKLDQLRIDDDEKAILATITISYRRALSRDVRQKFSAIGVAHLLAVSGFHVGIVHGFLALLFSFIPKRRWWRWLHIIPVILPLWAFAFITGLSVATVRAALMASLYLLGEGLRHTSDKYNTLAAAAFLLLVYNPLNLFDIGFQLSFLAVFFIFWLQPALSRWIEIRNPLLAFPWNILTITMAAQIGVSFLCCYYFGRISTIFLMANLVLSLLASALIPLAMIWMVLPDSLSHIAVFQWPVEQLMHSFAWFVDHFSMIPGASLSMPFDFVSLIGSYAFLLLFLLHFLHYRRRAWILIAALTVLLITLWRVIFMQIGT